MPERKEADMRSGNLTQKIMVLADEEAEVWQGLGVRLWCILIGKGKESYDNWTGA